MSKDFWECIAVIAICSAGAFSMYITQGETGIGWTILGLMILFDARYIT